MVSISQGACDIGDLSLTCCEDTQEMHTEEHTLIHLHLLFCPVVPCTEQTLHTYTWIKFSGAHIAKKRCPGVGLWEQPSGFTPRLPGVRSSPWTLRSAQPLSQAPFSTESLCPSSSWAFPTSHPCLGTVSTWASDCVLFSQNKLRATCIRNSSLQAALPSAPDL